MSSNLTFKRKCEHCGKKFSAKTLYTRYCSHACNSAHYKLLKRQEKINNFNEEQSKPVENLLPFNSIIQQKEFLNIEGQSIKSVTLTDRKVIIALDGLSNGVYIIKASTDSGAVIKKFIKE